MLNSQNNTKSTAEEWQKKKKKREKNLVPDVLWQDPFSDFVVQACVPWELEIFWSESTVPEDVTFVIWNNTAHRSTQHNFPQYSATTMCKKP